MALKMGMDKTTIKASGKWSIIHYGIEQILWPLHLSESLTAGE